MKIAPQYATEEHPVVYVSDASRAVVVVSELLGGEGKDAETNREEYVADIMEEYEDIRARHYASLEVRFFFFPQLHL